MFVKVLLVPNYSRPEAVEGAGALAEHLEGRGVEVRWAHDKKRYPDRIVDAADVGLVVSLGGDGTLLRAARIVGYAEIPVMLSLIHI